MLYIGCGTQSDLGLGFCSYIYLVVLVHAGVKGGYDEPDSQN